MVNKEDVLKIIKVRDFYLKKYNLFVTGLINKETLEPIGGRKINTYYYICEGCSQKKEFKDIKKFLSKNHEFGYLCQKCASYKNSQKEEFKNKEREATKKRWLNGDFDHLKESGYFLAWGRKYCNNTLSKTQEEKDEINYKRSKHFIEFHKMKNIKAPPFQNRFLTKEWSKIRMETIRRDNFTCQKCKRILPKKDLNVHHLVPFRICKTNVLDNLITLCKSCHSKVERYIEYHCLNETGDIVDVEKEMEYIKTID